jgi:hypothetical protein
MKRQSRAPLLGHSNVDSAAVTGRSCADDANWIIDAQQSQRLTSGATFTIRRPLFGATSRSRKTGYRSDPVTSKKSRPCQWRPGSSGLAFSRDKPVNEAGDHCVASWSHFHYRFRRNVLGPLPVDSGHRYLKRVAVRAVQFELIAGDNALARFISFCTGCEARAQLGGADYIANPDCHQVVRDERSVFAQRKLFLERDAGNGRNRGRRRRGR